MPLEEAVTEVLDRLRVGAPLTAIEEAEQTLPASIADLEEYGPVAARDVLRLEKEVLGRPLDASFGVLWGVVDVGDDDVRSERRVGGKIDLAGDLLVGAGEPEFPALRDGGSLLDLHADDFGTARRWQKGDA